MGVFGLPPPSQISIDIAELADQYSEGQGAADFNLASPAIERVQELTGNALRTPPMVATMFWQAYMELPAFADTLESLSGSRRLRQGAETYVVGHGQPARYDLVVLQDGYEDKPQADRSVERRVSGNDLVRGWRTFFEHRNLPAPYTQWPEFLHGLPAEAAAEASRGAEFNIIVAPRPEQLMTAHPASGWPVKPDDPVAEESTAGVYAYATHLGRTGVTAALHAIETEKALVNGAPGTVLSRDQVSDSCFIELEPGAALSRPELRGPLKGVSPRALERVEFHGVGSGPTETVVTGWDPEIPFVLPWVQLRLLTKAVTNNGDSGAALIDEVGNVLGFAFYRTGFGAQIEFAAWIWADSVFTAHHLT